MNDQPYGWVAATRGDEPLLLIEHSPFAYLLATVIALRARWRAGLNPHDLQVGEAFLGDHAKCGMTRQQYRTALKQLVRYKYITIKPTKLGTIAKLEDSRLYNISFSENNHQDNHELTKGQPSANQQLTTNEQEKKVTKEESKEGRRQPAFAKPTLEEVKAQAKEIGLSESEAQKFLNYYESNGWRVGRNPMKSWPHALKNWKNNADRYANNCRFNRPNPRNFGIATNPTEQGQRYAQAVARTQLPVVQQILPNPVATKVAEAGGHGAGDSEGG